MKIEEMPEDIRSLILPEPSGQMVYRCLSCQGEFDVSQLLYTCPSCGEVLLLKDKNLRKVHQIDGLTWRRVFDYRKMINHPALKGIFRYYELMAPMIPLEHIVYLGEGHTPCVEANDALKTRAGRAFYFKNDGLNPSASFKDRGMACALSYINHWIRKEKTENVLAICASTGDTSAAAALYASYLGQYIKSAVLLPKGKVTPQQLSQPLGSGAKVLEIPGVFDDCMKVVESLTENYPVALLNSKNSWRILGQESFSFEIAQEFDYDVGDKAVVVPIGNAGNITAVLSGFLKFYRAGIIKALPRVIGVQSTHADPVYRYYQEQDPKKRRFSPVTVQPSVAQAAMIGNPVSMPRVVKLVDEFNQTAGEPRVFFVQVREQDIMDAMIVANRNGNIACTQGGESLAGFEKAVKLGYVAPGEVGILDSTAHMLKFSVFQDMYFQNEFDPAFEVTPDTTLKNTPMEVRPKGLDTFPQPGKPLDGEDMSVFVREMTKEIARILNLA